VVGVNAHRNDDEDGLPILRIDPALERKQVDRVQAVRARRDGANVEHVLSIVRADADAGRNLMPALIAAARAHATEGEIVESLQQVFGSYSETPVF
jgi:methylmalonyl-CoA mutase N-terminal domain/subunit